MSTRMSIPPALELPFGRLVAEWREATQFAADPSAAAAHPAYRDMVALGPATVPLILAALRAEPDAVFGLVAAYLRWPTGGGAEDA